MKCAICQNGNTEEGFTTVVLERDGTTLVFKQVPAEVCDNCGEEYVSSSVNRALLQRAREELHRGVALEMLDFAALKQCTLSDSTIANI
uniref:YgiT-type zinc finger domain-containing protein n=1 Tax=Candidatus Kentrum sp. TUN TaxID=2126343 RepID=A0A450ZGW7_9GAMM|nr:MAG: YgiT-type zinc finger domain-containing protein [Candidatus Kentron sp. TUN]